MRWWNVDVMCPADQDFPSSVQEGGWGALRRRPWSGSARAARSGVAVCLAAIALWAVPARALDPSRAITQYVHDVWQGDEGLPQNTVRSVVQTPDGFLWLATEEGVVRFDGIEFTVFDKENTPGLGSNTIITLAVDRQGTLWIGTWGGGLTRMEKGKFSRVTGLPSEQVNTLAVGVSGAVWVGMERGGVRRLDGEGSPLTVGGGLPNDSVNTMLEDRRGVLWIGTRGEGLCRFGNGKCTVYQTKDGLSDDHVISLYEDPQGVLWVGTRKGLSRFQNGTFVSEGVPQYVSAIYKDRDGNLWVGTSNGLVRRTPSGEEVFTGAHGLSSNARSIFEDREGSLWIGTDGGGLNRLRDGKFITYTAAEGLAASNVLPIYQDRQGNIWIGSNGEGLFRFDGRQFTRYLPQDGLSNSVVGAISEDHEGALWIGTKSGLNRFKDGKFTVFTTRQGLSSDFVWSIIEDREQVLWVGTSGGGVNRLKDGRITTLTTADGLQSDTVLAIHQDRTGAIWLGTGRGLNRYQDGKVASFGETDGIPKDAITSFYEDAEGTLWIGTNGRGLVRWKDGRFFTFTTRQGLFNDLTYRILEDNSGSLWISCNKGLFRVSKRELDDVAAGRAESVHSVSYGKDDGLKSSEFNGTFQPAGWKTRDGRLWFPSVKGAVVVNPEHLPLNTVRPPVVIDKVIVDGKSVEQSEDLTLAAGAKALEFHYVGLSLQAPKRVLYKYKLEGFDNDWVDAGTRRQAFYTSIPPGRYRFHVIASNNDGVWSEAAASLAFSKQPFFYQTFWFYGLIFLWVVSVVGVGFRIRIGQLRRSHQREMEQREIQRERELTAAAQSFFLPRQGAFGNGRVRLKGFYRPAAKCGGDWWWYDGSSGETLSVMVGDVTGHGVSSAMITAVVAGALYVLQRGGVQRSISWMLNELNQELLDLCSGEYHMTLSAAQLDGATGQLTWLNAGGPPLLVLRENGKALSLASIGSPLGSTGFRVEPVQIDLQRGDRVLLFTDGLPELALPDGKQLGLRKLAKILERTRGLPLEEATQRIVAELDKARQLQPQADDIAFVLLEAEQAPVKEISRLPERTASGMA